MTPSDEDARLSEQDSSLKDDSPSHRWFTPMRLSTVAVGLVIVIAVATSWWEGRRRPAPGLASSKSRTRFADALSDGGADTARARLQPELSTAPHELIVDGGLYYLGSDTSYGYTAAYALTSSEGIIVIDPGLRYGMLVESLKSLGLNVADVKKVLVTHHHADHWFSARELMQRTGAQVWAHRDTARWMTQAGDLRQYYTMYASPVQEVPTVGEVQPLEDGDVVRLGQVEIEVLATPGHTTGSLCFRTRVRDYDVLFSGDTIMTLSPEATDGDYMTRLGPRFGGDAREYAATLKRLSETRFDLLLPGHPLLGKQLDASRGAELWRRRVDAKVAALAVRTSENPAPGDRYLDGQPKPLAERLYYLGEHDQTACYVLDTGEGLACVDPGRRSADELTAQLSSLGLDARRIKFILLTGIHDAHAGNARELCDRFQAKLGCGALDGSPTVRERLRPDHEWQPMESQKLGKCSVQSLAGIRGAGADRCWLVRTPERVILFGGDSVGRFARPKAGYHADVDEATVPAESLALKSIRLVLDEPVEWVLPAHPQLDESPNYQPGEWRKRAEHP